MMFGYIYYWMSWKGISYLFAKKTCSNDVTEFVMLIAA